MMKIAPLLLGVVALAGCGRAKDAGQAAHQDFGGTWSMTSRAVANVSTPCGNADGQIGATAVNSFIVSQKGSAVSTTLSGGEGNAGNTVTGTGTVTGKSLETTLTNAAGASQEMAILLQATAQGDGAVTGTIKVVCKGVPYDPAVSTFTMTRQEPAARN